MSRSRAHQGKKPKPNTAPAASLAGEQAGAPTPLPQRVAMGALLVALTAAVYIPCLTGGGFLWDDHEWLMNNRYIDLPNGWVHHWAPEADSNSADYWPLTATTFWAQYRLWGDNPAGYRVVAVVLHAFCAILIWQVLRSLRIRGAWIAATIFAVHPVAVASVAWIVELKNTLSMLFYLLAILAYLRFDRSRRWGWYAAALGAFVAAGLSKTSVIILPAALLGFVWWRRSKITIGDVLRMLPMFAISAVFAGLTMMFQHAHYMGHIDLPAGLIERLPLAGRAVWFYLYKALLPIRLNMIYPRWDIHGAPIAGVIALAALVGLAIVLTLGRRQSWARATALGMGYFIAALLPVLGFVDMSFMRFSFVSDHLAYVALPGAIALAVGLVAHFVAGKAKAYRIAAGALATCAIIAAGALTWQRAGVFADSKSLWTDSLAKNAASATIHYNLAAAHVGAKDLDTASEHYLKALNLDDTYAEAHGGLGHICIRRKLPDEAIEHYRRAVELAEYNSDFHCGLGQALVMGKRYDDAIKRLKVALQKMPISPQVHFHLGEAYAGTGNWSKAIEHYRLSLHYKPGWVKPLNNMAWILATCDDASIRDGAQAVRLAQQACETNEPLETPYVLCLAAAYAEAGRSDDAYKTALRAESISRTAGQKDKAKQIALLADMYKQGMIYRDYKNRHETPSKKP